MFLPVTQHFRFYIPAATLAYNRQGQQFAVTAIGLRSRSLEKWRNLLPKIINDDIHPGAKVFKVVYHWVILLCGFGLFC